MFVVDKFSIVLRLEAPRVFGPSPINSIFSNDSTDCCVICNGFFPNYK